MARCLTASAILAWVLLCGIATAAQAERARYDRAAPADKQFADVVLDLEQAIGRENFAIVGHNEIGQAVRHRGHARFPDAAIVHFCNLEYARRVIEIDPSYILYMPCRVAVFERGKEIHAASLLLPTVTEHDDFNAIAREVNAKIRRIIDYAVTPVIPSE